MRGLKAKLKLVLKFFPQLFYLLVKELFNLKFDQVAWISKMIF